MRSAIRSFYLPALAGAAVALAACGSPADKKADNPPATTQAAQPSVADTVTRTDNCKVTKEALVAELTGPNAAQHAANVIAGLTKPIEFGELHCSGNYVTAWTASKGGTTQPAGVLFVYLQASQRWHAADLGTSMDCVTTHKVPLADAQKLKGCRTS